MKTNKHNENKKNNIVNQIVKGFKYYKDNHMKMQLVIFIICLIIFFIAFSIGMTAIDFNKPFKVDINELANIKLMQIQFLVAMLISFMLALIPFFKKLSLLTVFYSYFMAFSVTNMFYLPDCNKICLSIFTVLSLFALSLNITLCFELTEKINNKFTKKIKSYEDEDKTNLHIDNVYKIDKESKNNKENQKLKTTYIITTFVLCMITSIISLIITKFI